MSPKKLCSKTRAVAGVTSNSSAARRSAPLQRALRPRRGAQQQGPDEPGDPRAPLRPAPERSTARHGDRQPRSPPHRQGDRHPPGSPAPCPGSPAPSFWRGSPRPSAYRAEAARCHGDVPLALPRYRAQVHDHARDPPSAAAAARGSAAGRTAVPRSRGGGRCRPVARGWDRGAGLDARGRAPRSASRP